jgi:hypothetical protein
VVVFVGEVRTGIESEPFQKDLLGSYCSTWYALTLHVRIFIPILFIKRSSCIWSVDVSIIEVRDLLNRYVSRLHLKRSK